MKGLTPSSLKLPEISVDNISPTVTELLRIIEQQRVMIENLSEQLMYLKSENEQLRKEVDRLKKHKGKPTIKPSQMEKRNKGLGDDTGQRKTVSPRKKELPIHRREVIRASDVPAGSVFKGHQSYAVQDIRIERCNTLYLLERWQTLEGNYVVASLPAEIVGSHYGVNLRSQLLYDYHHNRITQPLLLEQVRAWGIAMSAGQLNRLLTEGQARFHAEKDTLLRTGLEISDYIQADDTGARHQGKNGYCTHIGNELFAWFESTPSKSRINFLELLRTGYSDYVVDEGALSYMEKQKLPKKPLDDLRWGARLFSSPQEWKKHLEALSITQERLVRIVTEGALIGSVLAHGFSPELTIISDDAGQFNLFAHALCWIHAERTINKLIPVGDQEVKALEKTRERFWRLYADLKIYKQAPDEVKKTLLTTEFDRLFTTTTDFYLLDLALRRLYKNKTELLWVLERPATPLHNNLSERDIREYVTKRKISGGTRSEEGRRCRDTFMSLKKTCRKLGVSFLDYLHDRLGKRNQIPALSELMRSAQLAS
jgi:hypothetical protein